MEGPSQGASCPDSLVICNEVRLGENVCSDVVDNLIVLRDVRNRIKGYMCVLKLVGVVQQT